MFLSLPTFLGVLYFVRIERVDTTDIEGKPTYLPTHDGLLGLLAASGSAQFVSHIIDSSIHKRFQGSF